MSTQTDKARMALELISTAADRGFTLDYVMGVAQAALSELEAQPTDLLISANYAQVSSSATPREGEELIRAGNAMRSQLAEYPCMNGGYRFGDDASKAADPCEFCSRRYGNIKAWDAALPKDTGDTKGDRLAKAAQP